MLNCHNHNNNNNNNNNKWKKCLKWNEKMILTLEDKYEDHFIQFISQPHLINISFTHHSFHRSEHMSPTNWPAHIWVASTHEPNKLTSTHPSGFIQLVRVLHWHHRGYGFESLWRHLKFCWCTHEIIAESVKIISSIQ